MNLLAEIRRRNVLRVAAAYLVTAWVIVQVVGATADPLSLPAWTTTFVIVLLGVGLPIALVIAWAFELTPEGVRRTPATAASEETAPGLSRLDLALLAAIVVLIGMSTAQVVRSRPAPVAVAANDAVVPAGPDIDDDRPSIAVLPFADMSPAQDQEYFSDGLSEELLNQLAQVDGLRVIGRTSSFAFKNRNEDLRSIGGQLGVTSLLEGSVRKDGDQLRITEQLINASDGSHLWSRTYDRELDDVFAIQEDIARAVATALSDTLDVAAVRRRYGGTDSFEAYDAYLRGRAYGRDAQAGTPELFQESVTLLERAVAADPEFAQAWAELVNSYSLQAFATAISPDERARLVADTEHAAERALATGPDLWESQAATGWMLVAERRWVEADRALKRARGLAPDGAASMGQLYWSYLLQAGRLTDGLDSVKAMRRLDPLAPNVTAAERNILLVLDRPDAPVEQIIRQAEVSRDQLTLSVLQMWALGRGDAEILRVIADVGDVISPEERLAIELPRAFDSPDAVRALLASEIDAPETMPRSELVRLAAYAAALGDNDYAIARLREAFVDQYGSAGYWFLWFPPFKELRRTEAFEDLMIDVGLVDLWRATGDWGDFCHPVGDNDFACE